MARSIRIEYEGAYYHVMAKGNHRETIFLDDDDREYFLVTLGEVCERTGWRVHAWVLMGNHYHLLIETPEANLVEGMKWLQNTYTRRFNVKHQEWGRIFGDRYKAILIEGDNRFYYETLLNYIHLNPVRAGLLDLKKKKTTLLDYHWSSLSSEYAVPANKRKKWMACSEGLKALGYSDTAQGRKAMVERLRQRALEEKASLCGLPQPTTDLDKRCSNFRRGWYWGSQRFMERVLSQSENILSKQRATAYRSSEEYKAHGLQQAEVWLENGLKEVKLSRQDLLKLNGSDPKKIFLALLLRKKTTVSNGWLAEQLNMKSACNVSRLLKKSNTQKLNKKLSEKLIRYAKAEGIEF